MALYRSKILVIGNGSVEFKEGLKDYGDRFELPIDEMSESDIIAVRDFLTVALYKRNPTQFMKMLLKLDAAAVKAAGDRGEI